MSFEQLDSLRGYSIAALFLSLVAIGFATSFKSKYVRLIRVFVGCIGGLAGLILCFLFNFISGWNEYFASQSQHGRNPEVQYSGRQQGAARLIRTLGELDLSTLGLVFGLVGMIILVYAFLNYRDIRKTT